MMMFADILSKFSPLVEIGCGKGYWARLLRDKGAVIVAFDQHVPRDHSAWTTVQKGGPEVITCMVQLLYDHNY